MSIINLVSDTVTKPTPEMLSYMMAAKVGDDVFGEDDTVNALENKLATLFGKEAALFCPSGTMTNQIAIKIHTQPLDEVICDHYSHIYQYEVGGYAFHSGVAINPVIGEFGKLNAALIEDNIKARYDWLPVSKLVVLENSTNKGGGNYYTLDEIDPIHQVCTSQGLKLHLDGARLFNVLVETNESTAEVGKRFDSISICLSKGLGAPVGSVLIGDKMIISSARRIRKVMGGGMRQAGYLAAAGIYALDHHIPQLKIDNERAKAISQVLINCKFVKNILPVKTNILIFDLNDGFTTTQVLHALKIKNILATAFSKTAIRFVFHRDLSDLNIEYLSKELLNLNKSL
jgi:threonine aldolase